MTIWGLELWTSDLGGDRSANCTTLTTYTKEVKASNLEEGEGGL